MEAAGYTLDLYCDFHIHSQLTPWKSTSLDAQYYGQTYAEVKRMAKADGWKWTKDGKNHCKICAEFIKNNKGTVFVS